MATRTVATNRTVATARTSASGGGSSVSSGNPLGILLVITTDITTAGSGGTRSAAVARTVI